MEERLCGIETHLGPCTMKLGHTANFHRHREFDRITWKVKKGNKVISEGINRVPLNYAIKEAIEEHDSFTVTIKRVS